MISEKQQKLIEDIHNALATYKVRVKKPAKGALVYDYLIPSGVYEEQWDWDSFFMGMALASEMASEAVYLRNVMLNFILNSTENGYTPGCVTPKGRDIRLNHVKPFVAQGIFFSGRFLRDYDWINPHYSALKKVVLYREKHLWNEKYDLGVWFDSMESGIDNNVAALNFPEKTVVAVDVNSYIYNEYRAMSFIAKELRKHSDAIYFSERAEEIRRNINRHLWDEEDQSYYNRDCLNGNLIKRMSLSNFIALFANLATQENGEAMIKRYLLNPDKLWSSYGVRTLAKDDPEYNNVNMLKPHSNWQGPIWPIANYFYLQSLLNYGFQKEAITLAERITKLVLEDIVKNGMMHENYHGETGNPLAAPNFISWNLLVGNMLSEALDKRNPFNLNYGYRKAEELFNLMNKNALIETSEAFVDEIVRKRKKSESSLACITHPIHSITLKDGEGVAFVAGGTVGKSARWEAKSGEITLSNKSIFALPAKSVKDDYFRLLTQYISEKETITATGFNFAYPLQPDKRENILDGKLMRFAKENYIEGLLEKFVGKELENYLDLKKKIKTRVSVANDTICLLLSGLAKTNGNGYPQVAGVVGTGVNFAFFDKAEKWKNHTNGHTDELVAINLESANFNRFYMTEAGNAIDHLSDNAGVALAEKESSGAYLYRIYNWIMNESFGHRYMMIPDTVSLSNIAVDKKRKESSIANQIFDRSAQIVAIQLAGVLKYLHLTKGKIPVIMGGSLFWEGYRYKDRVTYWLSKLIPNATLEFINITDNDILGAAILANLSSK